MAATEAEDEDDEEDDEDDEDGSSDDEENKTPFPPELRARRKKLKEAKDSNDRALEAGATFAMADLQLRSAKYAKAAKLATAAEALFTKPTDKAKALRLFVKAVVREPERELFEDEPSFSSQARVPTARTHAAQKQVEKSLEAWQRSGQLRAAALMSLALADVHTMLARPREALQAAEKALDTFESLKDKSGSARALYTTARIRLRLGTDMHTRRAMGDLEKALEFLQLRGDTKREAATLLLLSRVHLKRQEYQDAYAFAGGAAKLAQGNGHLQEQALAMKELAHVLLLSRGDPDRAAQFALDAAEAFRNLNDWLSEIAARHVLSRAYEADGFVNMAHEALTAALRLARQLKDEQQIGAALEGISRILTKAQAPEAALEAMEEESKMASEANGGRQRKLAALERVALMQSRLGKHNESDKTAEAAVILARSGGRKSDLARALKLAAEVNLKAEWFEEGMDAANSAKKLFQELGDAHSLVALWRPVLAMHKVAGDKDAVQKAWDDMTKAHTEKGDRVEAAGLCFEKAQWLSSFAPLVEAIPPARLASKLFDMANDKEGCIKVFLWLCDRPGFIEKHPDEAQINANAAKGLCLSTGDIDGEVRALRALSEVHLRQNAFSKAVNASLEALDIARKAGGKRSQALALQAVVDVHAQLIFRDVENGLMPSERVVQDVIAASLDASSLFAMHGDDAGQVSCAVQLSRLHLVVGEVDVALQVALDAEEASKRCEDPRQQARALLALARAYKELGHARETKQNGEHAKELFEKANDLQGVAEVRRLLRSSRHLKSGDTFEAEFGRLWQQLYSPAGAPRPPQLADIEDEHPRAALKSFPESFGGELKWYIWNGIWHAANSREADYYTGEERAEKLRNADEDFQRMERHFLQAKLEKILPVSSIQKVGKQAEVAGSAACDAASAGNSLAAAAVQAQSAPRGIEASLWTRVVTAVRLAAAAVTEKLMECSSSESSSEEELPKGLGRSTGLGPPKALARPIEGVFTRGMDGQSTALVDVQELELLAEQRRTRILSRPPPPDETPAQTQAPEEPAAAAEEQSALQPAEASFTTLAPEEEQEECTEGRSGALSLADVLQAVRNDWSSKEVQVVLDKLGKIHVVTAEQLFSLLRAKGIKGVNNQLKLAGQKSLKSETLAALHEYGEASGGAVDSVG